MRNSDVAVSMFAQQVVLVCSGYNSLQNNKSISQLFFFLLDCLTETSECGSNSHYKLDSVGSTEAGPSLVFWCKNQGLKTKLQRHLFVHVITELHDIWTVERNTVKIYGKAHILGNVLFF